MGRAHRFLGRLLTFSLAFLALSLPPVRAASDTGALETILRKIEARHYRWVAIRAEVLLFFAVSGNSRAMCGGELLYQRLDERIFLPCVDPQKNLVFVFRSLDRRFDLYLPSQRTAYHGSVFDMENSPEIESHLKPRDLYRALKPSAFDPERTVIERDDPVNITLLVYDRRSGDRSLQRKLYLTPEGDVLGELYYGAAGQLLTQIHRYDFREIPARVSSYRSVFFPKKITIVSPESQKGSALFFAKVKPLDSLDPLEFILRVPLGTKEVFLDEKNPFFASGMAENGEGSHSIKAAMEATPEEPAFLEPSGSDAAGIDKIDAVVPEATVGRDTDTASETLATSRRATVEPYGEKMPATDQVTGQAIIPEINTTTTEPLTELGGARIGALEPTRPRIRGPVLSKASALEPGSKKNKTTS